MGTTRLQNKLREGKNMIQSFLILLSLFIMGCDFKSPPVEVDPDTIYDETPIYDEVNAKIPYDFDRHQGVLDISKLQYPNPLQVDYGEFSGFKAANFYSDDNGSIYFTTQKEADAYKTRSELREGRAWSTSSPTGHYWVAEVKLLKPKGGTTPDGKKYGLSAYTWMQVHGPNEPRIHNYPLIRLQWQREFRDEQKELKYDHIWATIIVNEPGEMIIYKNIDLGPRPKNFFRAEVYFKKNILDILIDGKVLYTSNVSYWEDVENYFKAGVYINRFGDGGEATAIFNELYFYDDEDDVPYPHH